MATATHCFMCPRCILGSSSPSCVSTDDEVDIFATKQHHGRINHYNEVRDGLIDCRLKLSYIKRLELTRSSPMLFLPEVEPFTMHNALHKQIKRHEACRNRPLEGPQASHPQPSDCPDSPSER
jgi:hypothetical protein